MPSPLSLSRAKFTSSSRLHEPQKESTTQSCGKMQNKINIQNYTRRSFTTYNSNSSRRLVDGKYAKTLSVKNGRHIEHSLQLRERESGRNSENLHSKIHDQPHSTVQPTKWSLTESDWAGEPAHCLRPGAPRARSLSAPNFRRRGVFQRFRCSSYIPLSTLPSRRMSYVRGI